MGIKLELRRRRERRRRAALGLLGLAGILVAAIVYLAVDAKPSREGGSNTTFATPVQPLRTVADTWANHPSKPQATAAPAPAPAPTVAAKPAKTQEAWPEARGAVGAVRPEVTDIDVERAVLITEGLDDAGKLPMMMNKSSVVVTRAPYKRVSVGSADVAEVNTIGPNNILVTAKKPGTTQLIVWDENDRSQVVDLAVTVDITALQDQLKKMFPGSKIEASMSNQAIVLKGQVPTLLVAEQAEALAKPYASKVLNFLEVSGGQQVMLQVRFAEVSRSATNSLGFNFGSTDGRSFQGFNGGQVSPLGITGDDSTAKLAIRDPAASITFFGKGLLGDSAFAYYIQALRQNNLLRVLAEPNLVAISGQEASFLAGGEFPVPVTQGGGGGAGGTAITVEYRSFGVKLRFVPVVLGDGKIRLKVAPEVSDLDFTTAVRFNGFVIPGLTQRRLETVIEMREGQTFALAGLLNNNVSATKDVTPLLGDLPVVGALFRSVRYQRKETELVVIVTPRLVEAVNPAQVPLLPGEKWRHPSEGDLFWHRDLGGTTGDPKKAVPNAASATSPRGEAPKFKGQYGFTPVDEQED
jgi:pilus assembly protein CpaC